jgi:hypothetical protein
MTDRGTKIFYRQPAAEDPINGDRIHVAWITGVQSDAKVDLYVKPNQSPAFDVSGVDVSGTENDGAACWSPWEDSLKPKQDEA